jgi:UPF0042 nucleotide-binding protein
MTAEPEKRRVALVTGLAGAGRASILRALEDVGYEAIDNPPLDLIEGLVRSIDTGGSRLVALGVDARSRSFTPERVLELRDHLRRVPGMRVDLVFAWAEEVVLLRRFTETRRRHPLSPRGRVADGIFAESRLIAPLHELADWVIDTSDLPLAQLRQQIDAYFGTATSEISGRQSLSISLISFAFPAGLPREAELVFDARFLRNPFYDTALRPGTGLDPAVAAYVAADPDYPAFVGQLTGLLDLLLPRFLQEGKKYATIAIGCTGGRHRSVTVAEHLASHLTESGWRVTATHRELAREGILPRQDGRTDPPEPTPTAAPETEALSTPEP